MEHNDAPMKDFSPTRSPAPRATSSTTPEGSPALTEESNGSENEQSASSASSEASTSDDSYYDLETRLAHLEEDFQLKASRDAATILDLRRRVERLESGLRVKRLEIQKLKKLCGVRDPDSDEEPERIAKEDGSGDLTRQFESMEVDNEQG